MKIKAAIALFAFIFIVKIECMAQKDSLYRKAPNAFFLNPLGLMDLINPSVQIGYERWLNKQFALQVETGPIIKHSALGYLFEAMDRGAYWYTNKGFKAKAELKYTHTKRKMVLGYPVYSVELFYTDNHSYVNDLFHVVDTTFIYDPPRDTGYYYYEDFFNLHKQRVGINLKLSGKSFMFHQWYIEPGFGIGVAYRKITHSDRENPNDEFLDTVLSSHNMDGVRFLPNFTFSLKIGYVFW